MTKEQALYNVRLMIYNLKELEKNINHNKTTYQIIDEIHANIENLKEVLDYILSL